MISVAIVDDDPRERQNIRACLAFVQEKSRTDFQLTEYETAEAFLMAYEPERFGIVLLDIDFPGGMNGMDAARRLRQMDERVILIFITNLAQMALQGYEVEALDFIVKPLEKSAFFLKMSRAIGRAAQSVEDVISIRSEGEVVRLHKRLIRHVDVQGHSVVYHSPEGVFTEYISLAAAEKRLNDPAFERSDRSCLVNLRYVSIIRKECCVVDGEEIPLARERRSAFKQAYADYLSGAMRGKG